MYRDTQTHKFSHSLACQEVSASNYYQPCPGLGNTLRQTHTWRAKHSCHLLLCIQLYIFNIMNRLEGEAL